jgi:hypothetical protein
LAELTLEKILERGRVVVSNKWQNYDPAVVQNWVRITGLWTIRGNVTIFGEIIEFT